MRYKRVATLAILAGCLLAVGMAGMAAADESGNLNTMLDGMDGDGTEENPYVITNVEELQAMNASPNSHYVLGNDINASETENWNSGSGFEPIDSFTGGFDGQGYEVKRIYINRSSDEAGLFGDIGNTTIENIGLRDASVAGGYAVGSLVGSGDNVSVSNSYATGSASGTDRVGGLVGHSIGNSGLTNISNSYAAVNVTINSGWGTNAGGLVGDDSDRMSVHQSYWDSDITGQESYGGGTALTTSEMTGYNIESNMSELDFDTTWQATESYPVLTKPANFQVNITHTEDITATETLAVEGEVTNTETGDATQSVILTVNGQEKDMADITLSGGESKDITLEWQTEEADGGSTYDVEIASEDDSDSEIVFVEETPPDFDISSFDPATDVVEGDPVTTEVTVENLGQVEGTQDITLKVGGSQVDATDVTLAGGASTTVTLEWQTQDVDGGQTYTMTASSDNSSVSSETYIVGQAHFDVSGVTGDTVLVGETMNVDATITNTGENEVTQSIVLEADGDQVDSTTVTLAEGESTNVTFGWEPATGGTSYDLTVRSDDDSASDLAYVEEQGAIEIETVDIEDGVEETIWPVSVDLVNPGDTDVTQNVSFEIDGTQVDSTEVTLEGGESATVDFEWQPAKAGEYTATFTTADAERNETVTVLSESAFNVILADAPAEVSEGETATVSVDVINTGDTEDTQTVKYTFDGATVSTQNVTLAANSSQTVEFDLQTAEVGDYTYSIASADDSVQGNISVLSSGVLEIGAIEAPDEVSVEDDAQVTITVENFGEQAVTDTVSLIADGEKFASDDVTLTGGETTSVAFDLATNDTGEFNYTVETATDESTFTVTVDSEAGIPPSDSGGLPDMVPDFVGDLFDAIGSVIDGIVDSITGIGSSIKSVLV